jgi:hypothetical protein
MAETFKEMDLKGTKNNLVDPRVVKIGEERAVRYLSNSRMNHKIAHE